MEGLGVGAVVYDRTLDRQGVVIDASPISEPLRVTVRWEPLESGVESGEKETLNAEEFRPAPRYSVVVPWR